MGQTLKPSELEILMERMEDLTQKQKALMANGSPPTMVEVEPLVKEFDDLHQQWREYCTAHPESERLAGQAPVFGFESARYDLHLLRRKLKK